MTHIQRAKLLLELYIAYLKPFSILDFLRIPSSYECIAAVNENIIYNTVAMYNKKLLTCSDLLGMCVRVNVFVKPIYKMRNATLKFKDMI